MQSLNIEKPMSCIKGLEEFSLKMISNASLILSA